MAYARIRIGRKSGKPWMGLNERIADGAQGPNEASAGFNFRVNKGVLETRPGITHATEVTARPTAYYAAFGATGATRHPSATYYDVVNGRVRWTWVMSVRTPSSFSGTHWILHRGVTIGGTQYEQGIYVDSTGKVYVKLVDSAGGDKSFDSGANVLAASTNYVLQVTRYDSEAYLHWATEAASGVFTSAMGTTSALGELDHAWESGSGAHPLAIGHKWVLATTTPSDYWKGEIHEITLLQYKVLHLDFGWITFADPLDPRVAYHVRFEDASGHMADLSSHGNDSDAEAGLTYRQTAHVFVEESAIVQTVVEFTNSNDEERIITIVDGTMGVGTLHV